MLLTALEKIRNDRPIASQEKVTVSCRSYVDLRRRLQPKISSEHLAFLASSLDSDHRVAPDRPFWDLARDVKQQLDRGFATGEVFSIVPVAKTFLEFLLAQPNTTPITAELTNVGQADLPIYYGPLELQEISFVPSQAMFGGVFSTAVTTFRGQMILNFMFSTPALSHHTMKELVARVIDRLSQECLKVEV
jgi:NRPS condensation-like uncharacterized protein